jgi:hypothetical protein
LFEHDYRNPAILIRLLSVDGSPGEKGQVSAVAVIIAYDSVEMPGKGILLHYLVHSCGRNKTVACAKEVLPDIDLIVEKLDAIAQTFGKTSG